MSTDWSQLTGELAIWRREGADLPIWWRDDDAMRATPALDRLLRLGERLGLPLHLAVIPVGATQELARVLQGTDAVVMVHGWAHRNHAPPGEKKAEFGQPRDLAGSESGAGLVRLRHLFGARLAPAFVPPWNRIDPSVVAGLKAQGYAGLSTYGPRPAPRVAGLWQINTHVDPIHWKAGGGLVPPDEVLARLVATLRARRRAPEDSGEPLGVLSHHLVHDPAIWEFLERLFAVLMDGGARPARLPETREDTA